MWGTDGPGGGHRVRHSAFLQMQCSNSTRGAPSGPPCSPVLSLQRAPSSGGGTYTCRPQPRRPSPGQWGHHTSFCLCVHVTSSSGALSTPLCTPYLPAFSSRAHPHLTHRKNTYLLMASSQENERPTGAGTSSAVLTAGTYSGLKKYSRTK